MSIQPDTGVLFDWKGKDGENGGQKTYPFNVNEDLYGPLVDSGILEIHKNTTNIEIDSTCTNSTMLPEVRKNVKDDSLLKYGTWAYLGSGSDASQRYFLWTSVDTKKTGAGKEIPVIMTTADKRYYIVETKTALRNNKGAQYYTIADHLTPKQYKQLLKNGTEYNSLQDAYDAYGKLLTEEQKYADYKDTLPK